jgi:small neutral amino acid transporter SnatA (MarC family)
MPCAMSLIDNAVGLLRFSSLRGQALLDLFVISLDASRVAGALILVPIGLPLLAGPGAISLVVAECRYWWSA